MQKKCVFDFDFIGIQNYTREVVKHNYFVPYLKAKIVKAHKLKVSITQMKWEVYPPSIYAMIAQFKQYDKINKIIITKYGTAFKDDIKNGKIKDMDRVFTHKALFRTGKKSKS
ncbi:family 1 glycosylhydrolase [uncultured Maribacter sp.]|uniref:family 1 glycosylhydrolase n=1 Tax=uncultured Maribacter sp. TaxID=431308 RepID=UPI0030D7E224|tara:strand:+ start:195 stop:533 length:339 start_codon:yes stop_codon:yes gene_type:complete